jgi:hypothetical protein
MKMFKLVPILGIFVMSTTDTLFSKFIPEAKNLYNLMKKAQKSARKHCETAEIEALLPGKICFRIEAEMRENYLRTSITSGILSDQTAQKTSEAVNSIEFTKSKENFGKKTKDMDKKLNNFTIETYIIIVKDGSAPLDERKVAMEQLGKFYKSSHISSEEKDSIKSLILNIHREGNILGYAIYWCMDEAATEILQLQIPDGKFPIVKINEQNADITNSERLFSNDMATYYVFPINSHSLDELLLSQHFVDQYNSEIPDNWLADKTHNFLIIHRRIEAGPLSSQERVQFREQLEAIKEELKSKEALFSSPEAETLKILIDTFPGNLTGHMFDKQEDSVAAGQILARLPLLAKECLRLRTKVETELQKLEA